jgi:hypothetical protein
MYRSPLLSSSVLDSMTPYTCHLTMNMAGRQNGPNAHAKHRRMWQHVGMPCLQEMGAVAGKANAVQGRGKPAVPNKLPTGVVHAVRTGKGAGDICGVTEVVCIVEREFGHHLCPVHLLRCQPLPRFLRNTDQKTCIMITAPMTP